MTQEKFKPFKVRVNVDLSGTFEITEEDLEGIRWHALRQNQGGPLPMANPLENDDLLSDLINEMIESKLDIWSTNLDIDDFDWSGASWDDLINAVRGLDANGEPYRPPEIPGQITIEDVLTEMV